MSLSATAGHIRRAEITTTASLLEAASAEQFPGNHDIVQLSASQLQLVVHDNVPDDSSPNTDLLHTFADSMEIIPCPEVAVMGVDDTHSCNMLRLVTDEPFHTVC
jgi:hypothetical protein